MAFASKCRSFQAITKKLQTLSPTVSPFHQHELVLSSRNYGHMSQKRHKSTAEKAIFETVNKDTKGSKRWTKEEEEAVILKEIQIRNTNPHISEKQINQRLSAAFNNVRTTSSFASRRRSTRWKEMVKSQIVNFAPTVEANKINTFETDASFHDEKREKDTERNEKSNNINNKEITADDHQKEPNESIFDPSKSLLNAPSEDILMKIGNVLRYHERNSNILENEAKENSTNDALPKVDESELYPSEDYKLWNHSKPLLQFPADSGFENIDIPKREDNDLSEYLRNLPSVTKILKLTMSEENKLRLNVWKEKMILKMGLEAFEKMQELTLKRGHRLHSAIERYFDGEDISHIEYSDPISNHHVESISELLPNFSRPAVCTESLVYHPTLNYKGYMDCVTLYSPDDYYNRTERNFCLIDWKTSQKPKRSLLSTFDNPLQIAAYIGALNHDPNYPFQINQGMIVVAYNNGDEANVLSMNKKSLETYWKLWLQRLKLYEKLKHEFAENEYQN